MKIGRIIIGANVPSARAWCVARGPLCLLDISWTSRVITSFEDRPPLEAANAIRNHSSRKLVFDLCKGRKLRFLGEMAVTGRGHTSPPPAIVVLEAAFCARRVD